MIDNTMYILSQIFLTPTLIIILLMFVYAFIAFGEFIYESISRRRNTMELNTRGSYPLVKLYVKTKEITMESLELSAYKRLEILRMVARIAPMMGLIATLIPLGPALKALTDGNIQGMSEGFTIAFAAVTLGLIAASLTYWISSVKKRWYANELYFIEQHKDT